MRKALVALLLCLWATGSMFAEEPWLVSGKKALALVADRWDWQSALPEWKVRFGPGQRFYKSLADAEAKMVTILVRPEDAPETLAGDILHEVAHAFDWTYLTLALREEWLKARELPIDTPWAPKRDMATDYGTGAGDFAESLAWTFGSRQEFKSCLGEGTIPRGKKLDYGCYGVPPDDTAQALIRRWVSELPKAGGD
jgi:hypothetical protein